MTVLLLFLATLTPAQASPTPAAPSDAELSDWVTGLTDQNYQRQQAALARLVQAGPRAKAAIPELIKLLGAKDSHRYLALVADVFAAIGPDAKEALPQLVARVQPNKYQTHDNDRLAIAIARIDLPRPEVTRALLLSSSKAASVGLANSEYLKQFPEPIVTQLVELCHDNDAAAREAAATVLGGGGGLSHVWSPDKARGLWKQAGAAAKEVPEALEKLLDDPEITVRVAAANAVANATPESAAKAIPAVVAAAKDAKYRAYVRPFDAARIFQSVPQPAAQALIPLFDDAGELSSWAIGTLARLPVDEQLAAALRDGKSAISRQSAAIALGMRYTGSRRSVPALTAALADPEFVVRFAAAEAQVLIGGHDTELARAIPILLEGLQQAGECRRKSGTYLRTIGAGGKSAIPHLKGLLDEQRESETAFEAALTLLELDDSAADLAVPALLWGALKQRPTRLTVVEVRQDAVRAARALGKLGPAAKSAIPALVKHFDGKFPGPYDSDAEDNIRQLAVVEAAVQIDPDQAEQAIPVLLALMKQGRDTPLEHEVLGTLTRIGPAAKSAMPTLRTRFSTEGGKLDDTLRVELALAMLSIDPENPQPALSWIRTQIAKGEEAAYELNQRIPSLGRRAKPLLPEVLVMLTARGSIARQTAVIECLAAIGPDASAALPHLKTIATTHPNEKLRHVAAKAIQEIDAK